jgi:hypothetical protein
VPDWQCPKCGVVYAKANVHQNKSIKVTLSSGLDITFSEVKLHDVALQNRLNDLNRSIARNSKGFSTGIGAIGSLEYVAEVSLVTGLIDGVVSGAMASQAAIQAQEAVNLYNHIVNTGTFVHISVVENIRYPQIEFWRASGRKNNGRPELSHLPGKYVTVKDGENPIVINWEKVESFQFIDR